MTARIPVLLSLAALVAAPGVTAQQQGKPTSRPTIDRKAKHEARKFRSLELPGDQVAKNVEKLTTELRWHPKLGSALAAAKPDKKPVLWIQALGDIDGFL